MEEKRLHEITELKEQAMIDSISLGISLKSDPLFQMPLLVGELVAEVCRLRGFQEPALGLN